MQMQMGREGKRNGFGNFWNGNENLNYSGFCCDYDKNDLDQAHSSRSLINKVDVMSYSPENLFPISSLASAASSSASSSRTSSPTAGASYIEHHVSKFDTLAGIAIKYGVEVADIKKMNGLVTDLQMFALKSLHIPLPGRHPPSPSLPCDNNTPGQSFIERTPPRRAHHDLLESFGSLKIKSTQPEVTSAMSTLQGFYGLKQPLKLYPLLEGCEMAVYRKPIQNSLEDGPLGASNPPLTRNRKSRSLAGFLDENSEKANPIPVAVAGEGDSDRWSDKLIRRHQKSETGFSRSPERLLEDNSGSRAFSASKGKHLALRPNAASRTALAIDFETSGSNPVPVGLGDSPVVDRYSRVRKSSSTPILQEQDSSSSTCIWSTSMWGLKPDLQAFSTAAITKPIVEGLPNPRMDRKNKAALD